MEKDKFVPPLQEKTTEPLPLDDDIPSDDSKQRLWIGNMDINITEYKMLQVLKQYGKIKQFDFLFHKSGAMQGHPRGFCFVSYEKEDDAIKVLTKLNNKTLGCKRLQVRWAHHHSGTAEQKPSESLKLPSIMAQSCTSNQIKPGVNNKKSKCNSADDMIKAIERKLNQMQESKDTDSSTKPQLHPLLALSKQNAAEMARQMKQPYYKRKRHKK